MKSQNKKEILYLGNIYAKRDWGHAKDYVEMQWKMLQQKKPQDFIIATGKTYTVKHFFNECCKYLKLKTKWQGNGLNEQCLVYEKRKFIPILKIDKKYFRPLDINFLKGDASKARKFLKWKPKYNLRDLVKDMMNHELDNLN